MEAMSADGGSVMGAARGLASRLRAAWGLPGPAGPAGVASADQNGTRDHQAREASEASIASGARRGSGGRGGSGARGGVPESAELGSDDPRSDRQADAHVPRLLRNAAAWSWRLLLVAAVAYLAFKVADALRLVVLPLIAALLATALLHPLTSLLRRAGLRPLA